MSEIHYIGFVVFALLFLKVRAKLFIYFLLNKGEILYIDEAGSKVFFDKEYLVSAKPDRVTRYKGKVYAVEFKSRKERIFEKDIIQALTAGLASWDSMGGVDRVVVYNGTYKYKVVNVKTKAKLFKKISKHVERAKKIKSGELVKQRVSKDKCKSCPYGESCKWTAL